ncbi:MAG: polyprenyl diphosphate synthase [Candidatus Saccharimonas sp.]
MTNLPTHIGFIVDGNRRWAKQRGLAPWEGHYAGEKALEEVVLATVNAGVPYVSAYVFSTENWKRSKDEVSKLMALLVRLLKTKISVFQREGIRLVILGSRDQLSKTVCAAIDKATAATADNTRATLVLCLNYGGQQEIADACKKIVEAGTVPEQITPELIAANLYEPDIPACDLIVRTSGEQRLSNFMVWRSAYSELYFTDKLWPDMTKTDIEDILNEYSKRVRRFGG